MTESAFGVDHGDVSKAFGSKFKIPKLGQQKPRGQMSGSYQSGQRARQGMGSAVDRAKGSVRALGQKAGEGTTGAGIGMAAGGAAMQRKPGLTGAGILGGGGLTLTGGVYANRKSQKPKRPGQV